MFQGLVKKLVCNDFASNTVQRWYQFNLSTEQVVTNMISGEQCVRYQLTHLSGTNIFLGVVNTTCDLVTAFCPCNTVPTTASHISSYINYMQGSFIYILDLYYKKYVFYCDLKL